jgi:tRNA G18 (ribose-2'-O)-methylase SpoU
VATIREVHDAADPALVPFLHLRDPALRRSIESDHGLFVVEGELAIRRARTSPYRVRTLLLSPARHSRLAAELVGWDVEVLVAPAEVMAEAAGFDVHRGALAVADRPVPVPVAELSSRARCLVVLEGLVDHENLGAIARSAVALGADGMLLDPTCADPLYRRAVRVSMGELLHLPWTRAPHWPAALGELKAAGFTLIALTPAAGAERLGAVAATCGPRVALLLGGEGPGLSAGALAAADRRARIPIRPGVDSLNVGHAAAIALHVLAPAPDLPG